MNECEVYFIQVFTITFCSLQHASALSLSTKLQSLMDHQPIVFHQQMF